MYPFGMQMPGRDYSSNKYRYGFNGKEKDKDLSAGDLDFGARIYDARVGRWLGLDPMQHNIFGISPFVYCYNNPTKYVDPDGRLGIEVIVKLDEKTGKYTIFSMELNTKLMYRFNTYYENHSIVYERNWHDYLQFTIQDSKGNVIKTDFIYGDKRYTTDNFWEIFSSSWEKAYAEDKVDDGYLEERDGIMLISGGQGSGGLKTKLPVYTVDVEALMALIGGAPSVFGPGIPKEMGLYLLETQTKLSALYNKYKDQYSEGKPKDDNSSIQKMLNDLDEVITKYQRDVDANEPKPQAKPGTPRLDPGKNEKHKTVKIHYDKTPATNERGPGQSSVHHTGKNGRDTIYYPNPTKH